MNNKILILSELDDAHSIAVQYLCRKEFNTEVVIVDTASFPVEHRVSMEVGDRETEISLKVDNTRHKLHSFSTIWWRRPQTPKIEMEDSNIASFCKEASRMLLSGSLYSSGVRIINNPSAEARAEQKPLQLAVAQNMGFRIPKTIMTNDSDEALRFFDSVHECIMKSFSPYLGNMVEAKLISKHDIKRDRLRVSPAIFQERIVGSDLRISVFGSDVYAAKAENHQPLHEIDWRTDVSTSWEPIELDTQQALKIIKLVKLLELEYGCIDMKLTPDGELVFLEINPSGQFIFIEAHTHQPLVRSMCKLLLAY